ncbi:phosphate ABC transporter substrate-binding protein PstS [Streptomyces sp. NPDC001941]|uniref:phosphate ABC transporter substrate-binding protein PstS n=1 Tax=Streptomyces sp. NPDC001941 TaxID=3154659 RepID=UPI00332A27EE
MKLQRKNGLRATALGALAVSGALVLTACGSDNNSGGTGNDTKTNAASNIKCDGAKGQLLASGSSAQKNAMDVWVKNYLAACKETQVNYKASSSGEGIVAFNQGRVGFAGSDSALKPEEVEASKKICKSGQGINLPMVGGPIAIGYNLGPDVKDLVLDAPTIAKIFNDKIKSWDDPAIAKLNPNAKLPKKAIQAFHRSGESGTTQNFGKYLGKTAKTEWPYEAEKKWPAPGGQSAGGSSDLAAQVKQVDGAIGYFELSYATSQSIPTVAINTGASAPVAANSENASKAIAAAKIKGTGKDLALDLDYATKAEGAYPLLLVTYEIVCDTGNKAETLGAVKSFLGYTASDEGQKALAAIGYAPIPAEINAKVRETVNGLN